jgi:DNA-binding HxlR family transcriptional regulator
MLGRTYERENCSAARALEVAGERWSLLMLRNALYLGQTRFNDFQRSLGLSPNILASRLERFVEAGLMRVRSGGGDKEYVLTSKGLDLEPVIIALTEWGDRWSAPEGPPIIYQHDDCGGRVRLQLRCEDCNNLLTPGQISTRPGPGAHPDSVDDGQA